MTPDFGQRTLRMAKRVASASAGPLGLFFFCLGLFFELLRPCRILDAADSGDESDQPSKKEDGRNTSEDELIERSPPNDDQPNPDNHSNESGNYGQILAHMDTSSFF